MVLGGYTIVMGNPISKKKAKANFIPNHHSKKVKALWNIGHVDKLKTAGQKQDEQSTLTVHYTASQHYQENVFIEGSRPKYLEDLHIEAQEGLKMLQQKEHDIERDLEDDQPGSTASAQQENEANCKDRHGDLSFDSTANRLSAVSAVTTEPVLTGKGSTFKPLNTAKRLDNHRKRSRRTTIMGIPQQVQKELCMARGALPHLPPDEDLSVKVIIPRTDGEGPITNHEGARVHLQDIEALHVSKDDQLLSHRIHPVYRDDFFLNPKSGTQITQRPRSLAVPGITTFSTLLQEPQGPVMSMSPQATYLSTIIPNAILPSEIDVIEIDRSCNQRSVRTLSKSSLAPASPASSHSGGGSRSTSSKWSHSQSSETVVSQPSTVSFKGSMPSSHVRDSMKDVTDLNEEQMSLKSSVSCSSSTSKASSQRLQGEETVHSSRLFSRNLSVIRAKLPPAPPRRTYSLNHEKLQQRPKKLAGTNGLKYLGEIGRQLDTAPNTKECPITSSTENISAQPPASPFYDVSKLSVTLSSCKPVPDSQVQSESSSSPQDIFERTLSPSSGYSSQSGTPTHSSKDIFPSSPGSQKLKPPKPERTAARVSPAVSVSSSLASLSTNVSDTTNQLTHIQTNQSQPPKIHLAGITEKSQAPPPPTASLRDLFNIPPPPKVKAPCPPPPETWAHNEHTTELLCGLSPSAHRLYELHKHDQTHSVLLKNQANLSSGRKQTSVGTEIYEINSENESVMFKGKDKQMIELEQVLLHTEEQVSNAEEQKHNLDGIKYKQESPVHSKKLQTAHKLNQTLFSNEQFVNGSCYSNTVALPKNGFATQETEGTDTEDLCLVKRFTDQTIYKHQTTKSADVETHRAAVHSSSSSPPRDQSPASPPPGTLCPVSIQQKEEQELTLEPSWPPPPPPMDESSDLVFEGQDAICFPPPPPPDIQESFTVESDTHYKIQSSGQDGSVEAEEPDLSEYGLSLDKKNHTETQIISSTMIEGKTSTEPLPVCSIPDVSHDKLFDRTHARSQCFENVPQGCNELNLTSQSLLHEYPLCQDDPLNSPDMSQKLSQDPAFSTDSKTTPCLPMEEESAVNFKRIPGQIIKDSRCKGLSSMQKCAPIPKEDANIPLVTPSVLQIVRLQTINVEDQADNLSQHNTAGNSTTTDQDLSVSSQITPQKPVRKSCVKPMQSPIKSSMRLQEAIRLKTAAMSFNGFPAKPSLQLANPTANSNDMPIMSLKTPDDCKSPASTASFIFSRSTKKVVVEPAASPEAQVSLKQSLAAELMQTIATNGTKKHQKVPPPVAKKPVFTSPSEKDVTVTKLAIVGPSSEQKMD